MNAKNLFHSYLCIIIIVNFPIYISIELFNQLLTVFFNDEAKHSKLKYATTYWACGLLSTVSRL